MSKVGARESVSPVRVITLINARVRVSVLVLIKLDVCMIVERERGRLELCRVVLHFVTLDERRETLAVGKCDHWGPLDAKKASVTIKSAMERRRESIIESMVSPIVCLIVDSINHDYAHNRSKEANTQSSSINNPKVFRVLI